MSKDSLRLFTPGRFDGLPGFRFDCKEGRYVTKDQISEYLEQYAERFGLPVRLGIDVLGLTPDERGQILVEWEHGRFRRPGDHRHGSPGRSTENDARSGPPGNPSARRASIEPSVSCRK